MSVLMTVSVPYWWHATLLELLWLAGGVLAVPIALDNLEDAKKDEAILEELRNDPSVHSKHYFLVEEAAKGKTFTEWLTLVTSVLICTTGIIACAVSNPTRGSATVTAFSVTVCLDGIAAVTAVRAYSARVRRRRMYDLAAGRSSVLAAEMRVRNTPPS